MIELYSGLLRSSSYHFIVSFVDIFIGYFDRYLLSSDSISKMKGLTFLLLFYNSNNKNISQPLKSLIKN